jgi:hypothetical protein
MSASRPILVRSVQSLPRKNSLGDCPPNFLLSLIYQPVISQCLNLAPIHMVSAFAARQRLVLGQVKVAEKSNEIVAIPAPLDMMAVEGAIVTRVCSGSRLEHSLP